jgi:asparagine synthase (glutamine-hydrolysing)
MCGIAGILGSGDLNSLNAMLSAIRHRGPDDEGIYSDPKADLQLGMRRLRIIDLTIAGHQPMPDASNRYWIVFNGEIYNYKEIRQQLVKTGYVFKSQSDTEVLVTAYAQWGELCLIKLRGMFAFAIWDSREQKLFIARDRLGIKPLYYYRDSSKFLFASEVKALLASGLVERTLDKQTVWDYLSHGSTLQPRTIINGISMLLPGHFLVAGHGKVEVHRYWDIAEEYSQSELSEKKLSFSDSALKLRGILEEATRFHLISDVPVGAFISGGIDSTIIIGLMSKLVSQPIKTYSLGFSDQYKQYNELKWAETAAKLHGCDHTNVIINGATVAGEYEKMIVAIDQPCHDGINSYFVAKAASKGITVALTGLGADELFAGYPHYAYYKSFNKYHPAMIKKTMAELCRYMPRQIAARLHSHFGGLTQGYAAIRQYIAEEHKMKALNRDFVGDTAIEGIDSYYSHLIPDIKDAMKCLTYIELTGYLRNVILRDLDAMSMAHSIETRPVFLDHVVAEFGFGQPADYKIGPHSFKRILVESCRDLLTKEIIERPKRGFCVPIEQWLRSDLSEIASESLSSSICRTMFSQQFIRTIQKELHKKAPICINLWPVIALVDFCRFSCLSV